MKKVNKYKILTVILLAIVVICSARLSFAVSINNGGNNIPTITTTNGSAANNTVPNIANNLTVNEPVNTPAPTPAPVTNTVLPETGAESQIGLVVLIVVASISAIYTYSKVKEYNV